MSRGNLTILHVEDEPALAMVVKQVLRSFGFNGQVLSAKSVAEANKLLAEKERQREPVDLIISDMHLPDGTGLDVIRTVRKSAIHKLTPLIVLSGETGDEIVGSAYALGANCYLPKVSAGKSMMETLQSFYQCWIETALFPVADSKPPILSMLEKAIELRTRTADVYLSLAGKCGDNNEAIEFCLNQALCQGNLANLMAIFRNNFIPHQTPPATVDKLGVMQHQVTDALNEVDLQLRGQQFLSHDIISGIVCKITDAFDEESFAEALGFFFPVSPVATKALKGLAANHLLDLATFIPKDLNDAILTQKAQEYLAWAQRLRDEGAGSAQ